jgi:hypothetical protein
MRPSRANSSKRDEPPTGHTKLGDAAGHSLLRPARLGPSRSDWSAEMVLNAIKPALQKPVSGALAVALLCLFLSTDLCAQTDKEAEEVATSLAICKGVETDVEAEEEEVNQYQPCEQYIDENITNNADTVKWMLEQIDMQKDRAADVSNNYYRNDQILQMVIVLLSLLTTVSAAITKLYPKLNVKGIDFALAPIALSALIAAVTSINAYYQFYQYSQLSHNMANDLTELEADIHFFILRHVAGGGQEHVDGDTINEWHDRLNTIMQRYSQRETANGV